MLETSQLQTLVAVTKARSFSRAAEDLNVTQSAISQSIKNLETKVGVKLFKRSGKKVVLTTEGEKLCLLARGFLGQMNDTLEEIRNDKESMSGKVRIGTLNGVGKSWLAPELLGFAKDNEDLTISISMGLQEELVREFENYRLDFLILPEDTLPSTGEKVFLSEEMSTLVFPDDENFPLNDNITMQELAKYPVILFEEEDHLFHKWYREKFGQIPDKLNIRFMVNSHGNMLQAVHEGLGIAVVPKHVFERTFYKDKLLTLGPSFEVSNGKFYIVYHKDNMQLLRMRETLERLTSNPSPLLSNLVH